MIAIYGVGADQVALDAIPTGTGLFAKAGIYDVVLRLSTNPGDILDDSVSTPRGLALKIIGVAGDVCPTPMGHRKILSWPMRLCSRRLTQPLF